MHDLSQKTALRDPVALGIISINMKIKLFNTLTRQLEDFKPINEGTVLMYNCGPTVYSPPHLGNMRAYVVADLWRRVFELNGLKVKQVINITDVGHLVSDNDSGEDKMEKAARQEGQSAWEIAKIYTLEFERSLAALKIQPPSVMPRATDHIAEQIEIIQILETKGFTYKIADGLYFDTHKFSGYGQLQRQALTEKLAGARVEVVPGKRKPQDFALWKFSPPETKRQMEWPSPWGIGFPGWHIECSAMARKYLGQPFDIHTGGVDHIPVHHANEIAQSEAAFGAPLAHYWLHSEFLNLATEKMSKSKGNTLTVKELAAKGIHPLAFRWFITSGHYRSHQTFSWLALAEAQKHLVSYQILRQRVATAELNEKTTGPAEKIKILNQKWRAALENDLDTPAALAHFYDFEKVANAGLDQQAWTAADQAASQTMLRDFDAVFAFNDDAILNPKIPSEIKALVARRETLRRQGQYDQADALRQQIAQQGFALEDAGQTTRVISLKTSP